MNPFSRKESELDEPIDKLLEELRAYDPNSPEFACAMTHLQTLTEMRANERKWTVSPEALVNGAVTLMGIGIVVLFEREGVITSKAMTIIPWKKSSN